VHQGVHSIAEVGQPQLFGDVTLSEGQRVALTQVGQNIEIAVPQSPLIYTLRLNTYIKSLALTGTTSILWDGERDLVSVHYFPLTRRTRFDRIGIHIGTGAGGVGAKDAIVVLYDDDGNLYPNNLLAQSGLLDIKTTGCKYSAIDLTLDKGVYWLGYLTNNDEWETYMWDTGLQPIGNPGPTCRTQYFSWYGDYDELADWPNPPNPFPIDGYEDQFYLSCVMRIVQVF